uniref:uncharacterized protein n=1 Tax=Centroberyx gerrardi TaxID=166262 RepID=UPI003AACD33A
MKIISIFYCLLYAMCTVEADITVEGFEQGKVSFQCSHQLAWKNQKYLCKNPCTDSDHKLITVTAGGRAETERISLVDSGDGVFTVTFTQLQKSDSGTYWCAVDRPAVMGVEGQSMDFRCEYPVSQQDNAKYFCRIDHTMSCENLIKTVKHNQWVRGGRFRLYDNTTVGVFIVTVDQLVLGDSGKYWCGVDILLYPDTITTKTNHPPPVKGNTTADVMVTGKVVYIGAGLGIAVLALAFVLLIFIRKRNRDTSASSGKDHDTVYATPSNQQQDVGCGITAFSSTANESLETENRSNTIHASSAIQHQDTSRDTIYSNVPLPSDSQMQPDSLFYSTVTFNQDTDCSAAAPRPASTAAEEQLDTDQRLRSLFGSVAEDLTKNTMRLSIWLFCAFRYLEALEVRGQEGGVVHISCPYDSGYEGYTKYLKRGIYSHRSAVIQTSGKQGTEWTRKGRYGLYDDISRRTLLVTICNLTLEDAGTYWCEIDTYFFDPKTEVTLTVAKAPPPLKPRLVTSSPPIRTTVQAATKQQPQQASAMTVMASGTSLWSTPLQDVHTGKELYSGVALAVAVLLLTLLLVINTIYEEILSSGHQRDLGPSVTTNTSPSVLSSTYAVITSHRGPDIDLPSNHNPDSSTIYNSPINSCLEADVSARAINQREENICSSSPSTEAGGELSCITVGFSGDTDSLHYSTVCFHTDADSKPKRTVKSAAEPSEIYTKKGRFSLSHPREKGHYTVTISSLTEDDAGIYWCAMKRIEDNSISQLTEVCLRVLNWDDIKPKEETGDTGKAAQLQCNYPRSHEENEKFLCKGENPFNCKELINATQNETVTEGRFTMKDYARLNYFTVHIKHLCRDDTGTYWCGSDRTWQPANYTRIHLTVATSFPPAASVSTPVTSTSLTSSSSTTSISALNGASLYTAVSVSLALLLIAATLIIIYRLNINKTQGAHPSSPQKTDAGNNRESIHADHDYEEVEERLQQPDSGSALPSVYATVNLTTNPSDCLQYASVSFHKSPHCADEASVSMSTEGDPFLSATDSSTCDYSCVRGIQNTVNLTVDQPPAPEEPLYSTARAH